MENLEKLEEQTKRAEKEPHYNFPEIAEMEPAMISLAEKLKDKIEKGEYDTLISDDVGGRIPTLILREIMLGKGRYDNENKLNTFFVAGGRNPDLEALDEYFKSKASVAGKVLLITECMFSGWSIERLRKLLEKNHIKDFDVASVYSKGEAMQRFPKQFGLFGKRRGLFYGKKSNSVPSLYGVDKVIGGVKKRSGAQHPFSLRKGFLESKDVLDNSLGRATESQEHVKKAREDVHTMAERVLEKVW